MNLRNLTPGPCPKAKVPASGEGRNTDGFAPPLLTTPLVFVVRRGGRGVRPALMKDKCSPRVFARWQTSARTRTVSRLAGELFQ